MSYIPSINIESNFSDDFNYIVTENSKSVLGNIVNNFNAGNHSFTIIGTYGTGKSSFILALEKGLIEQKSALVQNKKVFGNFDKFEFLNIVGDYSSMHSLLCKKLSLDLSDDNQNVFDALNKYYQSLKKKNTFLFIVVDEFGKVLEHAANNNPEKELYFLQKLAEFVNTNTRNIVLLTTLHQNFSSYAHKLNEFQKQEWNKVKGRFKEIVFAEPVEQLLYLASQKLEESPTELKSKEESNLSLIYNLAKKAKICSDSFSFDIAKKIYPLDPVSANCLTLAIQRYGQNERTLFSFLNAYGKGSLREYIPNETLTYNLATVYDYLIYNFYSALSESNTDSTNWRAINVAIERVENGAIAAEFIHDALSIVKTIGLLNIFSNTAIIDFDFLSSYAKFALNIDDAESIINKLVSQKIIRYANYKSQYILFEGTDIDIEDELFKASSIVPVPTLLIEDISAYLKPKAVVASQSYYKTGTPRFFEYKYSNEPIVLEPSGDIDGYINIIFPLENSLNQVVEIAKANPNANLYAYFVNTESIIKHLHEIKKIQYVIDNVAFEDRVAKLELSNQLFFISNKLNEEINSLISSKENVIWIYKGKTVRIKSISDFNKYLSYICNDVYSKSPIIKNELFNKQKISSAISLARVNLLDAMLNHSDKEDFNFPANTFPPEKTIYQTIFKKSGIHRKDSDGVYILTEPNAPELKSLWNVSVDFINNSTDKPRKISELIKILKSRPYKLKQGVIDFWIPIFLFIKQQDFALYNGNSFVLNITKEVFELLQKHPNDFSIKSFNVSGVRLEFFKKYRKFLNKDENNPITISSFLETIRPFFKFYNGLNTYAKNTRKFDSLATANFRDVLSKATDPSKTFFDDLPEALGYKALNSEEFVSQYIDLIKASVHELNICYDLFISRIETQLLEYLGITDDFESYKHIISARYESINPNFLTPKARAFYGRLMTPANSQKEFYERICNVVLDKRLDETKDSEEELLIRNLIHLFKELDRYTSLSDLSSNSDDEAFNIELASSKGTFAKSQTYILPQNKISKATEIADAISKHLTGDKDLDICILLKLLNNKLN